MSQEQTVTLRPIESADLPFLRDLTSDPEVRRQVVGWGWPVSLAGQESWFAATLRSENTKRFMVVAPNGAPVGLAGLWDIDWHDRTASVGIKIGGRPDIRGKGYGSQALAKITRFAFMDVGLERLWAHILATNSASLHLFLDTARWTKEGCLRQHIWNQGSRVDVIVAGLLRADFEKLHASAYC